MLSKYKIVKLLLKLSLSVFFVLLIIFGASNNFVSLVLADPDDYCADGYYCYGTSVLDVADSCQGPHCRCSYPDNYDCASWCSLDPPEYCTQDWEQESFSCDSQCRHTESGTGCNEDCSTYGWSGSTNCCAKGGDTPTPVPTSEPPCNCSWGNDSCGAGICPANEMRQVRSCDDNSCSGDGDTRCIGDPSCCAGGWCDAPVVGDCGTGVDSSTGIPCTADERPSTANCWVDGPVLCSTTTVCNHDPGCLLSLCTVGTEIPVNSGTWVCPQIIVFPGDPAYEVLMNFTQQNGNVTSMSFNSTDPSIATLTSPDNVGPPFSTFAEGFAVGGPVPYTATATMDTGDTCACSGEIHTSNADGWWQVSGGDVIAGTGSIASSIPAGCNPALASCNPTLILDVPGTAIYAGTITVSPGGIVSSEGWEVNITTTPVTDYDYAYFENKATQASATFNPLAAGPDEAVLGAGGATETQGFEVYRSAGSVTFDNQLIIQPGVRLVLFVNGDLNINDKITMASPGTSFLLVIASGNINIDPLVGDAAANLEDPVNPPDPDIEGMFVTNRQFITGTNGVGTPDLQLHVRGTVAGLGDDGLGGGYGSVNGLELQRELVDNASYPAEIFEYAPDMFLRFPNFFSTVSVRWREVAP